jgi:DHA3 family macrolide efflux protein-like MFS transporter
MTSPENETAATEQPHEGTPTHENPGGTDRPMRPFWILWTGQAVSLIGSNAVQFAIIWWLTRETGSAAVLAMATFVGLFPQIALGPFIGTLVDRWNRKVIMFAADAAVAAASLPLALAFYMGEPSIELVMLILFVRAMGSAFHSPAMVASTTLMIPEKHLTRIQGLNQSMQGGLAIVTAPLGALLVTALPMAAVLLVDVFSALVALIPLMFIRVPQPDVVAVSAGTRLVSVLRDTRAGFAYLRDRTGHMGLVLMGAAINLCLVPAFALMPILVAKELGGTAMQLGWMNISLGIGMLAGGILLGAWGGFSRRILTSLVALIGLGCAVLLLAFPDGTVTMALAGMLMVGFMVPLVNGPIQAILQATIDPAYQGRIFALVGSLAGATIPLGLLMAAPVADLLGVRAWYALGGTACLAMGLVALMVPAILKIEGTSESSTQPEASFT